MHNNDITYFDSFWVEHIPKEIKAFIDRPLSFVLRPPLRDASHNKNITTNIFRIEACDSIMCGYFCIGFIDFMFAGKTLTEFTNLFYQITLKKNDNIVLNILWPMFENGRV